MGPGGTLRLRVCAWECVGGRRDDRASFCLTWGPLLRWYYWQLEVPSGLRCTGEEEEVLARPWYARTLARPVIVCVCVLELSRVSRPQGQRYICPALVVGLPIA
jgi:hypothetical protein